MKSNFKKEYSVLYDGVWHKINPLWLITKHGEDVRPGVVYFKGGDLVSHLNPMPPMAYDINSTKSLTDIMYIDLGSKNLRIEMVGYITIDAFDKLNWVANDHPHAYEVRKLQKP